jgi:hypothetical protein
VQEKSGGGHTGRETRQEASAGYIDFLREFDDRKAFVLVA